MSEAETAMRAQLRAALAANEGGLR